MKSSILTCLFSSFVFLSSQPSLAQSWDSCSGTIAETGTHVRLQTNFGWPWNIEVNLSGGTIANANQYWIEVTRSDDSTTRKYVSDSVDAADPALDLSINLNHCGAHILSTACSGTAHFGKYVFPVSCEIDHDYTPATGSPCHPGIPCH